MSRGSIVALVLAALVAGTAVGFELRSELRPSFARAQEEQAAQAAQAAQGPIRVTSTATQNEAFCFLFNESTMQLASYTRKHDGTLELEYVRECTWDFNPKIEELPKTSGRFSVANMKKLPR